MTNEVFDPSALETMCRHDLPGALRQLAKHLEHEEISAMLWSFQGDGMMQDWRREHFLMALNLAVVLVRSDSAGGKEFNTYTKRRADNSLLALYASDRGPSMFVLKEDGSLIAMKATQFKLELDFQRLLELHPELLACDLIDSDEPRRWYL